MSGSPRRSSAMSSQARSSDPASAGAGRGRSRRGSVTVSQPFTRFTLKAGQRAETPSSDDESEDGNYKARPRDYRPPSTTGGGTSLASPAGSLGAPRRATTAGRHNSIGSPVADELVPEERRYGSARREPGEAPPPYVHPTRADRYEQGRRTSHGIADKGRGRSRPSSLSGSDSDESVDLEVLDDALRQLGMAGVFSAQERHHPVGSLAPQPLSAKAATKNMTVRSNKVRDDVAPIDLDVPSVVSRRPVSHGPDDAASVLNDSVVEATNWMNDPARMHAPGAAAGTGVLGAKSITPGAGTGETEGLSSTSNEPEGADQLNEDGAEKQPKKKGRARRNSDDSSLDSQDEELDRQLAEDFKFVRKTLPRSAISHEEERMEFRCLDYSPLVNVRPIDLSDQFRPVKACRKIRLYIAITAYNEEGDELRRTLMGIADNLPKLAKAGLHWSEVCVCILIDGREAASQSMLDFLQFDLKLYDPTILRTVHRERPVVMHVFERSVEMSKHATQREYHYPLQCMLALKERNGGKLNSHLWFFSGFCVQVNPKYTLLFDVGTVPHKNAIVRMYIGMEDDPQIGGACGEISVRNARPWHFLDAAQAFEYKISHVLDKACESVFGYISVLPGAFSMYRWVAIRGEPLCAYFTIEEIPLSELGAATSNMYLAEDRILCFEILAKRHRQWLLRYIPGALAETDAPATLVELIKQRRRWLNGSFFALVYYLVHFSRFMHTSHGTVRKLLLLSQFLFQLSVAALSWFTMATMFLSFLLIFSQAVEFAAFAQREMRVLFVFAYVVLLFVQIMGGLAGRVNQLGSLYFAFSIIYAIIMIASMILGAWLVFSGDVSPFAGMAFAFCIFSYLFCPLIHGSLSKVFVFFLQYLVQLPLFVNLFPIYSFCNMHDISWGTKEGNLQNETRRMHEGKALRAIKRADKAREAITQLRKEQVQQQMQAMGLAAVPAGSAQVIKFGPTTELGTYQATPEQQLAKNPLVSTSSPNMMPQQASSAMQSHASASLAKTTTAGLDAQRGGATMMKVIDEDNDIAGFIDVAHMGQKDYQLQMTLGEATMMNATMAAVAQSDLTRKLIRDAKKAAQTQAEAAAREKRLAEELAFNKQQLQTEFNFFRMRMLTMWIISNALFVVLIATYDPTLNGYAPYVAATVVYTIGFKLFGSVAYQLIRLVRWMFRRCCGFCYRIDRGETNIDRIVCCCRPSNYYALDDLWESEHDYEHAYPEEVGNDVLAEAQANVAAMAAGLTLAGTAPDGTPLYFAEDGSGPYDVEGNTLDPLALGFTYGPNGELLTPDGMPVVDERGSVIIIPGAAAQASQAALQRHDSVGTISSVYTMDSVAERGNAPVARARPHPGSVRVIAEVDETAGSYDDVDGSVHSSEEDDAFDANQLVLEGERMRADLDAMSEVLARDQGDSMAHFANLVTAVTASGSARSEVGATGSIIMMPRQPAIPEEHEHEMAGDEGDNSLLAEDEDSTVVAPEGFSINIAPLTPAAPPASVVPAQSTVTEVVNVQVSDASGFLPGDQVSARARPHAVGVPAGAAGMVLRLHGAAAPAGGSAGASPVAAPTPTVGGGASSVSPRPTSSVASGSQTQQQRGGMGSFIKRLIKGGEDSEMPLNVRRHPAARAGSRASMSAAGSGALSAREEATHTRVMSTNGGLQASGRGSRSARGAGSDVPVDVDIRAMAFGYHDPDTGKWVPPVRGAARIRHGDVDTDSDEEDKEFDRRLSSVLARGTGAAASSRSVAKAAAAPARAAPVSPRSHVDLSDLLNDAEQQSTRVISRRKLGASDV